jgi:spermidine synthase
MTSLVETPRAHPSAALEIGETTLSDRLLPIVFFASGFAAILYQIIWQRTLFALLGINIESVTVVVTSFMLGLGVGSLVGGFASKLAGNHLVYVFAFAELLIAGFGAISLPLFHKFGPLTLMLSGTATALLTLLLLLIPTIGMGGTLPVLVAHCVRKNGSVGWSVGTLYAVNTLGSAAAAFLAVFLLMRALGQQGTIWVAVACNVGAAVTVLLAESRQGR